MIDAHCHLTDESFGDRLPVVLSAAAAAGITHVVQGGVDPDEWDRQRDLAARVVTPRVIVCYGLHPWTVARRDDTDCDAAMARLTDLIADPSTRPAALGEVGIDGPSARGASGRARQLACLDRQLGLAVDARLPVVLHVVGAQMAALRAVAAHAPRLPALVIHAFAGDGGVARRWLDLGASLSLGPRTVRHATRHAAMTAMVPDDRLLIESDAPHCGPGFDPAPTAILSVAAAVAASRGTTADAVLALASANAGRIFGVQARPTAH